MVRRWACEPALSAALLLLIAVLVSSLHSLSQTQSDRCIPVVAVADELALVCASATNLALRSAKALPLVVARLARQVKAKRARARRDRRRLLRRGWQHQLKRLALSRRRLQCQQIRRQTDRLNNHNRRLELAPKKRARARRQQVAGAGAERGQSLIIIVSAAATSWRSVAQCFSSAPGERSQVLVGWMDQSLARLVCASRVELSLVARHS